MVRVPGCPGSQVLGRNSADTVPWNSGTLPPPEFPSSLVRRLKVPVSRSSGVLGQMPKFQKTAGTGGLADPRIPAKFRDSAPESHNPPILGTPELGHVSGFPKTIPEFSSPRQTGTPGLVPATSSPVLSIASLPGASPQIPSWSPRIPTRPGFQNCPAHSTDTTGSEAQWWTSGARGSRVPEFWRSRGRGGGGKGGVGGEGTRERD